MGVYVWGGVRDRVYVYVCIRVCVDLSRCERRERYSMCMYVWGGERGRVLSKYLWACGLICPGVWGGEIGYVWSMRMYVWSCVCVFTRPLGLVQNLWFF